MELARSRASSAIRATDDDPCCIESRSRSSSSAEGFLTTEQREHALRRRVRQGQHVGPGIDEDLLPREFGRFKGEVRVPDDRLAGGQVFERDLQLIDIGLQRVSLERTEAPPQSCYLPNGLFDNFGRLEVFPFDERPTPPGHNFR